MYRLRHTHCQCAVVGLSGGLDSTLALIVMVHAFLTVWDSTAKGILAVTMPCFGTTKRTKSNAVKLAGSLWRDTAPGEHHSLGHAALCRHPDRIWTFTT